MSSMVAGAVPDNAVPLIKGRQSRKFTPENISRIKTWIAQGVGRDEIASRLEVTVGSLQVTCSRLGISLRKSSLLKSNGAIQPLQAVQRCIKCTAGQDDHAAQIKFTLLIQKQNRQAAFDLPLHRDFIERLALEASVRGQTISNLIGNIVKQVMAKDLVDEILRNGTPLPSPTTTVQGLANS